MNDVVIVVKCVDWPIVHGKPLSRHSYFQLGSTFWSAKSTIPGFCTNGGVVAYFTFTAVHPCYGQFCNNTGFVLRPSNYVVRWTTGGNTYTYYNASSSPMVNYNGSIVTNFTGFGRINGPVFNGTTIQSLACIGDTGNVATNTVSVAIAAYTTIGLPFTALQYSRDIAVTLFPPILSTYVEYLVDEGLVCGHMYS
jgi:hypothetical protein